MTEDKLKKEHFKIKAGRKTETQGELQEIAIWPEKGIPMQAPDGTIFLISVDNSGTLVVEAAPTE